MRRDLESDQAMLREVLALAERRDTARAAAIAERALASGFEHPLLLNVVATRLEHEGRLEEALQLLERAVRLVPDDVGVRNALSLCLQRLGRPADALRHIDRLLKAHPELGFAHANRGNALIALGEFDKAKDSHLRALELEPDSLAAQGALASIATHFGEYEDARVWARKVLSRLPGYPDAVLSMAAAELASGSIDSAQILTCQLLADPRAGPVEKARANGLLGDVLDAGGRFPEALDAYAACNEALGQVHRGFSEGTSIVSYTESITAAMQRVKPQQWAPVAPADLSASVKPDHVFLLGFPCSGITQLGAALAAHPHIASLVGQELLKAGVLRFMREPLDFGPLLQADEGALQELRAAYWRQVREAGAGARCRVFVDQLPLNTLKLPLIARLFPRAKILFACRDPRDVVQACFRRRFSMNPATYQLLSLEGTVAFYDATMRLAGQARLSLGLDWHVVRYESLVDDPVRQLRMVCASMGIEATPELEQFALRPGAFRQSVPGVAPLPRSLDHAGVGDWRHYQSALAPILPRLETWVQSLGYGA